MPEAPEAGILPLMPTSPLCSCCGEPFFPNPKGSKLCAICWVVAGLPVEEGKERMPTDVEVRRRQKPRAPRKPWTPRNYRPPKSRIFQCTSCNKQYERDPRRRSYMTTLRLCEDCTREKRRVYTATIRAKAIQAPATLTFDQWLGILEKHQRRCIYCGDPFEVLDHRCGLAGGTVPENCVPACNRCNALKGTNPNYVPTPRRRKRR